MSNLHPWASKYPPIHLLALAIDPTGTASEQDIIEAICLHFSWEVPKKGDYQPVSNSLAIHLNQEGLRTTHEETVLEMPVMGVVRVLKRYNRYKWVSKDGKVTTLDYHASCVLDINYRPMASMAWDDDKAKAYIEEMRVLYDAYEDATSWYAIFCFIDPVFNQGGRDHNMQAFEHACEKLTEAFYDGEIGGTTNAMLGYARFVAEKWCTYLWEKQEENKPLMFTCSMARFIYDNLPHWLNGESGKTLRLNLFTKEHEEAVRRFEELEEQEQEYLQKSIFIPILDTWKKIDGLTKGKST